MALKRWFSPNIFIYDRIIHDEQQLKQAQQSHWRQAELLFERINARLSTSKRYRPSEYHLINVICAPGMPLIAFSASPLIVSQRRGKRRKRSSEPQIPSNAACDEECLPGRDMSILTPRCKITLNQCGNFGRHPGPHLIINSEKSPSSLNPPLLNPCIQSPVLLPWCVIAAYPSIIAYFTLIIQAPPSSTTAAIFLTHRIQILILM